MQLMTRAIERKLEATKPNSTDSTEATPVIVKYFDPCGRYTFYVTEGERWENGDWWLYGWCVSPLGSDCDEFSSVMLSELQSVRGPLGLGIERDLYTCPDTLRAIESCGPFQQ